MSLMFLPEVEQHAAGGKVGELIALFQAAGQAVPQIWHLFAFKPAATRHLADFTQQVMRGPSPLTPALRELIAAFTSARNHCLF